MNLTELSRNIHSKNVEKGWYSTPREDGTLIALMHSELSEALEGLRKNLQDDKLPHRKAAEVELADLAIRLLDFCGYKSYDIQGAIDEKLSYNETRYDHSLESRSSENGKKF
jgi:NTP pyrophosphatase (non-canonical NTP hydrolase)